MMPEGMSGREQLLWDVSGRVLMDIWMQRVNVIKSDYEANHVRYDQENIDKFENLLSEWTSIHGNRKGELKYFTSRERSHYPELRTADSVV